MSNQTPVAREKIPYTDEDREDAIKIFKAKKIPVYEPGEDDYERYIATANLLYRFSSPPCVVRPKCVCDVRDVIKIAKPRKIPITIKNGGHSYAGGSTTNIGILMELGLMNEVNLDKNEDNLDKNEDNPDKTPKTVTVKGGALWFHVYKKLVSERLNGVMVNGGRCPTVGVSGFMLGGGLSPFTRSFGMGCDTVKEFTIVTAEGDEVTVSECDDSEEAKGKLFWALRGAGGGNFGVVVEMKLALKKLKSNFVVAGRYTWFPKCKVMDEFMTTMNGFYTRDWPNEMTIDSTWLCDLANTKTELAVRFLIYYNGAREAFDQAIDDWTLPNAPIQHAELKKQLKWRSLQEKSSRFLHETLAAQWIEETKKSFPTDRSYRIYTSFVFENGRKNIEKITRIVRDKMKAFRTQFEGEKGTLQVSFIHSGGAANVKKPEATAFRWRGCIYHVYIMIQWDEKWLERNMRVFLKQMKPELSPFGMVQGATYINYPDGSLRADAHEKAYYGDNHEELRRIKQIWDKDNFFKWPQGIQLPGANTTSAVSTYQQENDDLVKDLPDAKAFVVNEEELNEEELTDALAKQQWESYRLPTLTDFYGSGALPALVQ